MKPIIRKVDESSDPRREKFVVSLKCQCGQVGAAIWEENAELSQKGPRPVLLEVSSGFYFRVHKKDITKTEIVCARCECIIVD